MSYIKCYKVISSRVKTVWGSGMLSFSWQIVPCDCNPISESLFESLIVWLRYKQVMLGAPKIVCEWSLNWWIFQAGIRIQGQLLFWTLKILIIFHVCQQSFSLEGKENLGRQNWSDLPIKPFCYTRTFSHLKGDCSSADLLVNCIKCLFFCQ